MMVCDAFIILAAPNKLKAENVAAILFNVIEEAHKVKRVISTSPQPNGTLCNDADLAVIPIRDNTMGFFIMLLPGQMAREDKGNFTFKAVKRLEAYQFLSKHNVQQLSEGLLLVSSGCTWDVARRKVRDIHCLGYWAVAFSSPERLEILAENPANEV
ncbi:hypothetical protein [Roseateles albus]|uniref:Uncharacterized protein n=1 Tax=Roseateles albus TaxID=2987525 RepID=A0ABT5KKX2_9BURK|nr:hypothetical protein [Roseateles albus]MDC8773565.1 hypothetical protein [Roseateles albus]